MKLNSTIIVLLLFIIVFGFVWFFSFSSPTLNDPHSKAKYCIAKGLGNPEKPQYCGPALFTQNSIFLKTTLSAHDLVTNTNFETIEESNLDDSQICIHAGDFDGMGIFSANADLGTLKYLGNSELWVRIYAICHSNEEIVEFVEENIGININSGDGFCNCPKGSTCCAIIIRDPKYGH